MGSSRLTSHVHFRFPYERGPGFKICTKRSSTPNTQNLSKPVLTMPHKGKEATAIRGISESKIRAHVPVLLRQIQI